MKTLKEIKTVVTNKENLKRFGKLAAIVGLVSGAVYLFLKPDENYIITEAMNKEPEIKEGVEE